MTTVKVAQFKSHLSSYLKRVRHGEQVIVTDRETPIARVIPFTPMQEKLQTVAAKKSPKIIRKIDIPPAPKGTDSLKALNEDRKEGLEK